MYVETLPAQNLSVPGLSARLGHKADNLATIVRDIRRRLDGSIGDFPQMHMAMRDLERLLLRGDEYRDEFNRLLKMFPAHEMDHFNNLYCYWETQLEKRFVQHLEQGICRHVVDYPLYARFERLIEREVSLLDGYQPRRLLFIGSGPMPITAFCMQHRIDAPVDCLERSPEAVAESRSVIDILGLSDKIRVITGLGESVDVEAYDVVLVALLAKPKKLILENLLRTCRRDVKIICRTSEGSRCFVYEPTTMDDIPKGLNVVRTERAGIDDTISSSLLLGSNN